ncbi:MAG: hypothetical protein A2806_02725 [Candidatus Terrybacteria bacterium RIFCSPHIGHO2_01_FULL_48_17]|uniref:Cell division protein FtsX n=1 Tax=Candidatus Terrybacteria bacterium RIFCSPHIGHO2_01_FULL_48_17 TaxID=1802362 RepID=A0A1G2PHV7_9BACT|nr:MAG: hypothetical protein A2806_02725 [Candidatus Terrybacteria bacterium RIFCSPHIGHO2_01_FULL_48_17]OHA53181.1 MAG: hypothetical protein A3A30_00460 [Candidatus Terrybacteria bacterium RIFCSPLOWO2_01_FULL_48_14]
MLTFFRILKTGTVSFWRNIWLTSATVSVLTLSLSVALGILLLSIVAQSAIAEIENKVEISVYFVLDADESDILSVRDSLEGFASVKAVSYVSREEALERFKSRHQDSEAIQAALTELGDNPLSASLAVRATDPDAYAAIASFVEGRFANIIDKVNYQETKPIIERLFAVTNAVRLAGIVLGAILFVIAGLISFNTVRLAIFSFRDEIAIMRLVGASNWFIRGPFLVEGVLTGLAAAGVTFALFVGVTQLVADPVYRFVSGIQLDTYYLANWVQFLTFAVVLGVVTSAASSFVAVRRYLKI